MLPIGFETIHALSGERMRVIKNENHPWYTCEKIEQPKQWNRHKEVYEYPRAICHINNLQP